MIRGLVRLLLRCAPRDYRERHGDELLEVHDALAARHRAAPDRLLFLLREVVGMSALAVRLRAGGAVYMGSGNAKQKRRVTVFETTAQDVRFATRTLRRNPGFTVAVVAVLALGIGATTAIFSAANAFFFRPLPFRDADRLVMLYETNPEFDWTDAALAPANALDWREQVDAFEDVALYSDFVQQVPWIRNGEPELIVLAQVSGNFFDVLGAMPQAGRSTRWEETWEGRDDVVVLSHGLWQSHFGGDPKIVGQRIEIAGTTVEVLGVMPPGFSFPGNDIQMWSTFGWAESNREEVWFRRAHWVRGVARVTPGQSLEQANAHSFGRAGASTSWEGSSQAHAPGQCRHRRAGSSRLRPCGAYAGAGGKRIRDYGVTYRPDPALIPRRSLGGGRFMRNITAKRALTCGTISSRAARCLER